MAWTVNFVSDEDKEYVGVAVATYDYGGGELFEYSGRFDLQDGTSSFSQFIQDAKNAKIQNDAKKASDRQIALKAESELNK